MSTQIVTQRLTTKQIEFLQVCDASMRDGWTADMKPKMVQIPLHFGPLEWEAWSFYSRSSAMQFVDRLVARGLLRTEKTGFYWITDEGRAAIAKAASQKGPHHEH